MVILPDWTVPPGATTPWMLTLAGTLPIAGKALAVAVELVMLVPESVRLLADATPSRVIVAEIVLICVEGPVPWGVW
jgi:hypothetical protein